MPCQFPQAFPLLHSSLFAQQECTSSVSDQWHSVAGDRILLLRCHYSLTLWRTLVLLWCWKGLPQADGDEPAGDWATSHDSAHDVLVNKKSNTMLVFNLFSTVSTVFLCPSSIFVSPKFVHLILQSPRMFHLHLFISCISSGSFLAALSVLVFHVPMVMLSLLRFFDDAPVVYLTPPSWCTAEGAVLVDPGGDRSGLVWWLVFIICWVI